MPEGTIDSSVDTPIARYRALRHAGEIRPDPKQAIAAEKLQSLHNALIGYRSSGEGWLSGWKERFGLGRRTEEPPQGLYLYGPVGRGKSMLMDLLYRKSTRLNSSHS